MAFPVEENEERAAVKKCITFKIIRQHDRNAGQEPADHGKDFERRRPNHYRRHRGISWFGMDGCF